MVRVSISTARLGQDMLATRDPPLRFAWVERGNPVTQNPETHRVLEAFRALDFRVVVEQFLTDTAREADIILPAKTMFEQTDVIGAYWHPYLQLKQKVLEPPGRGEARDRRSTGSWPTGWDSPARPGSASCPSPATPRWRRSCAGSSTPWADLTLEELREGPVLAPGHQEIAFADRRLPTPIGRIELRSDEAARRWGVDPLPSYASRTESVSARPG